MDARAGGHDRPSASAVDMPGRVWRTLSLLLATAWGPGDVAAHAVMLLVQVTRIGLVAAW